MKKLLTILCTLFTVPSHAQTGMLMNRYYITGSLSLGNNKSFADTSAWLQIGKDTTKRGVLFPKVILDSVATTKRGLYVYDLKDSVLYHIDGTKKVRYMTYKDTSFLASKVFVNTENAKNIKYTDSAAMLNSYLRKTDTANLSSRINLKLNYADTSAMLSSYLHKTDTASLSNRISLKLAYSDTALMLNLYLRKGDTTAMLSPYLRKIDTTNKWFARTWMTDYLTEGTTNKYYTDSRARNAISASGAGLSYNSTTGVLTNTATLDDVLANGNISVRAATVGKVTINGNTSASSNSAVAALIAPTLTATANNDTLTALKIGPVYSTGSFTGTLKLGISSLSSSALNFIVGNTAFGGFNGTPDAAISLANNKSLGWQLPGGFNSGFVMLYDNTDHFSWIKQSVTYFDMNFNGPYLTWKNFAEVGIDRTGNPAKFVIAADDNQQAYINFRQSSTHATNRWDLSSAATSHDFSLYNYTTSTAPITVTASNNVVNFSNGIKLGGYTGAYQTSAVLGMPNNAMMGWAMSGNPSSNLALSVSFDASNTFHMQYTGGDFYTYSSNTHTFSGNDFFLIGSTAARIRIMGSTTVDQQLRFMDNTSTEMRIYRPANQAKIIIDKVVTGTATDLFTIDGSGNAILTGSIKTAQPTGNGAGAVKLGKIRTGSDSNKYLELDVDGTVYYIHALTSLP